MKRLTLTSICTLFVIAILAQVPQGISHQAVIRNAANELVSNSPIGIQVSIIQGSTAGDIVYSETHLPVSNTNGLISFIIGQGTVISGVFAEIDWSDGSYFIEISADPAGGTNYSITGTSQMFSVPYALHAETAKKVEGSVAANIYPPTVNATPASNVESFSATINGIVNAEGFSSTVVFEWGVTSEYGNSFNAIQSPVTGSTDAMVSLNLNNLQSATTYHYRIHATNAVNISYSDNMVFTTQPSAPQLTTNVATNILAFSTTSGGTITYDGGIAVTARGVVWSTNPSPTLADNFTVDGVGIGFYTSEMTGLNHSTTYYVCAYATNAVGTTYGNQISFTTLDGIIAIITTGAGGITNISAVSGGNITTDGGLNITARGIVWGSSENPTIESNDGLTYDGVGAGVFVSNLTGLFPQTIYHVRAYATNSAGTFYGVNKVFQTYYNIITDHVGNSYGTIIIGSQEWMAENLKTTHYSNGIPIENPTIDSEWQNNTNGAYAWYNNDINWKDSYGALYNWHAVNNSNGLCPLGWHLPTDAEYTVLSNYLDGTSVAGGKMKSTRTFPDPHPRWNNPNADATNISNWSGFPGGLRSTSGSFFSIGNFGYWWSSSEYFTSQAWIRHLDSNVGIVYKLDSAKGNGFSVRCLKD